MKHIEIWINELGEVTRNAIEDAYSGILNHLGVEVEMVYEG